MELLSSLKAGDYCVKKIVAAALHNEVSLTLKQSSSEELLAVPPAAEQKSLALRLKSGDFVVGLVAILSCMSPSDAANVDVCQWLRFCHTEIDTPLQLLIATSAVAEAQAELAQAPADVAAAQVKAKEDLGRALGRLNANLAERTFVATETVTIADISLYCSVFTLYKAGLMQKSEYSHVYRWMMTCVHHGSLSATLESIAHSPSNVSSSDFSFSGGKWGRGRIRVKELLSVGASCIGKEVVMKGWIRTSRSAEKGKTIFVELTDGSTVKGVQVNRMSSTLYTLSNTHRIFVITHAFSFPSVGSRRRNDCWCGGCGEFWWCRRVALCYRHGGRLSGQGTSHRDPRFLRYSFRCRARRRQWRGRWEKLPHG